MTSTRLPLVSQDYFDELCIENYELFCEESYDSAVEETITQLKGKSLLHISLTHPSSEEGQAVRKSLSKITATLNSIKSTSSMESSLKILKEMLFQDNIVCAEPKSNGRLFLHVFTKSGGFEAISNAFVFIQDTSHDACGHLPDLVLSIIDSFPLQADKTFRSAFQSSITSSFVSSWIACFASTESNDRRHALLSVAYKSIKRCEANKRLWMEQKESPWGMLLVENLSNEIDLLPNTQDDSDSSAIVICQMITCLCTFDDFSEDSSDQQRYVQVLYRAGAVDALERGLKTKIHSAFVDTLRALAIQDEVVQNMESVVQKASRIFVDSCSGNSESNEVLLTALVGLFRNASANDGFKKQLGADTSLLTSLQMAMESYPENPRLQEHAIAWIAALALRHPDNADRLGSSNSLVSLVLTAMRRFADRPSLQRQAALAFRNIASRLQDEATKNALGSEVEDVLRGVTAKHLSCQDEVYAALRDLGLNASSVHIERQGDSIEIRKGPLMFGQALESNFRAEYDE